MPQIITIKSRMKNISVVSVTAVMRIVKLNDTKRLCFVFLHLNSHNLLAKYRHSVDSNSCSNQANFILQNKCLRNEYLKFELTV